MVETIGLVIITGYNACQVIRLSISDKSCFIQHGLYYNRFILACQVKF